MGTHLLTKFVSSVFACGGGCETACRGRNDVDTEFEMKAFQVCDKDGDGALDWQEVENCEKEYGPYLSLKELPDENDFQHFDTNKDGKLLFYEWLTQVNKD